MLTARRMRERQEAAAAGTLPPPKPARRQDLPWYQHEAALKNLEERLRAELAGASSTHTVNIDSEEFQAIVKPMVEDFESRAKVIVERNDELSKQLDEALKRGVELEAEVAELNALLEQATTDEPADEVATQPILGTEATPPAPTEGAAVAPLAAEETPAPDASKPASGGDTKPKGSKPKPR